MRRKPLLRLFLLLALLSLSLYFLWRQPWSTGPDHGANISLSFNLCLPASEGTNLITADHPLKVRYLREAWIDSTRQFYTKALQITPADTLYISTWSQVGLREGKRLLDLQSGDVLTSQAGEKGSVAYYQLFSRRKGLYFSRYLFQDRSFDTLVQVDRFGPDSAAVRALHESDILIKQIQPCL